MPLADPNLGIEQVQLTLISMCDLICQISLIEHALDLHLVESGEFEGKKGMLIAIGTQYMLKEVRYLNTLTDFQ